jgi:hypothetical protein
MSADQRFLAVAHLWIFSAGGDSSAVDTQGEPLAKSLATLLKAKFLEGRREAATMFLQMQPSGEHPVASDSSDDTGRYDLHELDRLLRASGGMQ